MATLFLSPVGGAAVRPAGANWCGKRTGSFAYGRAPRFHWPTTHRPPTQTLNYRFRPAPNHNPIYGVEFLWEKKRKKKNNNSIVSPPPCGFLKINFHVFIDTILMSSSSIRFQGCFSSACCKTKEKRRDATTGPLAARLSRKSPFLCRLSF